MERQSNELTEKLLRLMVLLHRCQAYRFREFGPFGDPLRGQGRILSILKMQPQISQKELSYLLDMRQQSLSELLKKLESRGMILRTPSEDDRRIAMITLTEEGRAAAEGVDDAAPGPGGIFGCLSEEEQKLFEEFLDRMTRSLEETMGAMDQRLYGDGRPGMNWGGGFHHGHGGWGEHPHGGFHGHGQDGRWEEDTPHRRHGPHSGSDPDAGDGE